MKKLIDLTLPMHGPGEPGAVARLKLSRFGSR